MKIETRLSRLCAWSVRCACVGLALAFCTSTFAADGTKHTIKSDWSLANSNFDNRKERIVLDFTAWNGQTQLWEQKVHSVGC